jgi:hypothetical protein
MAHDKEKKKLADKLRYERNKEKIKEQQKLYKETNKENYLEYQKEYKKNNKESQIKYVKNNKDKINEQKREREKIDPLFKLSKNIRNSIRHSFKNNNFKKVSRTEQILDCTFIQFKEYLESKFEPWMNWENYGNWNGTPTEINTAWDIDHRIPTSTATTELELLKLNHYTNLQPLCSYNNRYVKKDNLI